MGILNLRSEIRCPIPSMEVKFANPPLQLGLKYHDPPHLTELKEKCSRLFKVHYSKLTRKKRKQKQNKRKAKKTLGQNEWKLTAKKLLKPLHLSKSRMLQSLLAHYLFIMKE